MYRQNHPVYNKQPSRHSWMIFLTTAILAASGFKIVSEAGYHKGTHEAIAALDPFGPWGVLELII